MYRACMLVWRRREYVVDPPPASADGAALVLSLAQRRRRAMYYSAPRAAVPVSRCALPSAGTKHCLLPQFVSLQLTWDWLPPPQQVAQPGSVPARTGEQMRGLPAQRQWGI